MGSLGRFLAVLFYINLACLLHGMEVSELLIHKVHILVTKYLICDHRVNLSILLDLHNMVYLFKYTIGLSLQLLRHSYHLIWLNRPSSEIYWRSSNLCGKFSCREDILSLKRLEWTCAKYRLRVCIIILFNVW